MNNIIYEINNEIVRLEENLNSIDNFLRGAPSGYLNIKKVNERIYYYHQISSELELDTKSISESNNSSTYIINSNKNKLKSNSDNNLNTKKIKRNKLKVDDKKSKITTTNQKYIKKKDVWFAESLAQKAYYMTIRPILEKQRKQLIEFLKIYKEENMAKAYDNLNNARKSLVKPFVISKEEALRQWKEESYEGNEYHSEKKIFDTLQGEKVRSKSEMIIANMLYEYKSDILYKYERPIDIVKNMTIGKAYPDFTILNKHTGKIVYWEHAGCMDNAVYANDFIRKVNNYALNNIVIGKNLVATYESREYPLDVTTVRNTIKSLL